MKKHLNIILIIFGITEYQKRAIYTLNLKKIAFQLMVSSKVESFPITILLK